jgi:hypothetical protein
VVTKASGTNLSFYSFVCCGILIWKITLWHFKMPKLTNTKFLRRWWPAPIREQLHC